MEVSLDELLNGYSRTADYQKKTQSLAEQRKAVEADRQAIEEAKYARDTYAQRLQAIEEFIVAQSPQEDLNSLKENDPIGYAVKVAELSEKNQKWKPPSFHANSRLTPLEFPRSRLNLWS